MAKTKASSKVPDPSGLVQINLRVPPELLEAVDACVDALNKADPFHRINRSDFIREAVVKAVRETQQKFSKPSKQ